MKKTPLIAVSTTILALFTSSLSYAAPQAEPILAVNTSQTTLTPEIVSQAVTELKTAGIPHETLYDTEGIKTTFHLEQGLSFTLIEPATTPSISPFLGGNFNWGNSYILLNKFDMDLIVAGGAAILTAAICRTTVVGAIACRVAEAVIITAVTALTNSYTNPCGNKQMKIYLRSNFWGGSPRFGGCV